MEGGYWVDTEVRLDGWREGGLGQQRDYGGGCGKLEEEPWYIYIYMMS